ncbi:DUF4352 domain-containing protein [uncultured Tenacibaculum sp.]|uniref:DUF4352 domain-containing protein n=1 Tax=uncultured Tenacibaculum sp. TaxID=174713 RepID=UPI002631DD27|nr:DUF4352 domain-containing protein [uncultured Tenacibaculum sp.]
MKNLKVKIIKTRVVGSYFGHSNMRFFGKYAEDGMTFILVKLKLTNQGENIINIDFDKVFVSDEFGDKFSFHSFYGFSNRKLKLKPGKRVRRNLYFEFPKNETPVGLHIDKNKFKIN